MTYLFHDSPPFGLSTSPIATTPLRFTPTAWGKVLFWRDRGNSQLGAWGLSHTQDLLLVEDVRLVRQTSSLMEVTLDNPTELGDGGPQTEARLSSARAGRIWIQLHADPSSQPTVRDEGTFTRALRGAEWGVLCILGRQEAPYARIQFFIGPGGNCLLPVGLQFGTPFTGSNPVAWEEEYQMQVSLRSGFRYPTSPADSIRSGVGPRDWEAEWEAHLQNPSREVTQVSH